VKTRTINVSAGANRVAVNLSLIFDGPAWSQDEAAKLATTVQAKVLEFLRTLPEDERPNRLVLDSVSGYANDGQDEVFDMNGEQEDEV
jgi:hypothetical protein